jgi:hypothetical protein
MDQSIGNNNITPPPELVQKWVAEIWHEGTPVRVALSDTHIATRAAQWGSDQELEACCLWLNGGSSIDYYAAALLRSDRRPKPPSLKEEALAKTKALLDDPGRALLIEVRDTLELNRRALEQLPND